MTVLVLAEHDNATLRGSTLNTITAAAQCDTASQAPRGAPMQKASEAADRLTRKDNSTIPTSS